MFVELEIKYALQESDKFELVGLVGYLLRVQLISGELLIDRRPLRHRSSGFGVERSCTVHSSGLTDLPSYSLGKLLLQQFVIILVIHLLDNLLPLPGLHIRLA